VIGTPEVGAALTATDNQLDLCRLQLPATWRGSPPAAAAAGAFRG